MTCGICNHSNHKLLVITNKKDTHICSRYRVVGGGIGHQAIHGSTVQSCKRTFPAVCDTHAIGGVCTHVISGSFCQSCQNTGERRIVIAIYQSIVLNGRIGSSAIAQASLCYGIVAVSEYLSPTFGSECFHIIHLESMYNGTVILYRQVQCHRIFATIFINHGIDVGTILCVGIHKLSSIQYDVIQANSIAPSVSHLKGQLSGSARKSHIAFRP